MKKRCVIFDIDGCLLNVNSIYRDIHELNIKGSDNRWRYFYNNCNGKKIKANENVRSLYNYLRYSLKQVDDSIIITARSEKYRGATLSKLADEYILCDKLYMRKADDFRPAYEVKKDYLVEIMEDYDVIAFFDDEIKNCEIAKELGIASLKVV